MVLVKLGAPPEFLAIFISLGISLLMLPINGFAKEPDIDGLFEVQLGTNLAVTKKEIIRDNEFMTEFRIPSPSSYPGSLFDSLKVFVNGEGKVASISGEATLKDTQTCNMHRNAYMIGCRSSME